MVKSQLEKYILQGLSTRKIANKLNCSQSTIKYWLKKFELKTKPVKSKKERCNCGKLLKGNSYKTTRGICKECFNNKRKEVFKTTRKKAIEYLGGKCIVCGFKKYLCSLDIHHLDPKKKDPSFSSSQCWSWKRLEKELKNCILLCRNCHGAVHSREYNVPLA